MHLVGFFFTNCTMTHGSTNVKQMCVINILFITPYGKLQFRIQTDKRTDWSRGFERSQGMNLTGTIRDKELSGSEQVNSWGPPSGSLRVWGNGPASPSFGESKFVTTQQSRQCSNVHTEQRTTPQRYAHNPCRTGWYWSTGRVARSLHSVAPSPAAMLITLRRLCGSSSIPFIQNLRTRFLITIPAKQH